MRMLRLLLLLLLTTISYASNAQLYDMDWVAQSGGTLADWSRSISTDSSGNIATTGYFLGTGDYDPGPSVNNLISNGMADIFIQKLDVNGDYLWAKNIGSTSFDEDGAIKFDRDGNVIIIGRTAGTADMDPGPGVVNFVASGGSHDLFVLKLDPNGDFLWAKQFEGTSSIEGFDIDCDDNNNLFITGYFNGIVDFDPTPGTNFLSSVTSGYGDAFVLKMDENGGVTWVKQFGGTGKDEGKGIQLDSSGNIFFAGYIQNIADMDPSAGVSNLTSNGSDDAFVAKLDQNGNLLWAQSIGGSDSDQGYDVACDNDGNVYYTGYFKATADFDPGVGVNNVVSGGSYDSFTQKYSASGALIWTNTFGANGSELTNSIVVDDSTGVYITGAFQTTVDFNPGAGVFPITTFGGSDVFIVKFDSTGNFLFANQMGGTGYEYGEGITIDVFGSIVLTGQFGYNTLSADLDPGVGVQSYTSLGHYDIFVLKLRAPCETQSGGIDVVSACAPYTWSDGIVYTVDNFSAIDTILNLDGCDSIITLNLTVIPSSAGTDVITACDSYTWVDGITYTTSNSNATYTYTNAQGCDSIVTLDLTINPITFGTDPIITCDSYTWLDGIIYSVSNNSATYTYTNAQGCDSIVTLNLTINPVTFGTDAIVACNSYTWVDGNTYNANNSSATYTYTNAQGCDSIVTIDLIINSTTYGIDNISACGMYIWVDGITYTANNNSATYTYTNSQGCDSIVTLDLTINNPSIGTDVVMACDTFTWVDGNTYTSNNNSATYTFSNMFGCDSVVTLNLTVNTGSVGSDVVIACVKYTWVDGVTYFTDNNTATFTYVNIVGCDSIVTLDLTVYPLDYSVTVTNPTITSNDNGASYQWLNCNDNYSIIVGEISQSYTPTVNGDYAVQVSNGPCIDTSECTTIAGIGIEEVVSDATINVYPNPTSGGVSVDFNQNQYVEVEIKVMNSVGQVIRDLKYYNTHMCEIDIANEPGIYFVEITADNSTIMVKVVKQD